MFVGRHCRLLAVALLVGVLVPLASSKDIDPIKQREEQKKVKAKIDEAARRASSTLNAMRYQRLSPTTQQAVLEDVAKGLRGLSEGEIKEVLALLDAAIAAPGDATKEQKEAYAKQRDIVTKLRGLTGRLEVLRNLDEAAAQLEAAADKQLIINAETLTNSRLPRVVGRRATVVDDREELSAEEADLRIEIAGIFERVHVIVPVLNPEQKDRLDGSDAIHRGERLISEIDFTVRELRSAQFEDAGKNQRRHANELKALAAALRTPPGDRLAALKAAQEKVVRAIDAQTRVNSDTQEKLTQNDLDRARRANAPDPKLVRGNELANQQTKAEFATRDARLATLDVAPKAADLLAPAENKQFEAQEKLRDGKNEEAKEPQEKALDNLKAAKDELDRQIAAAELAKTDPLAAVKQAAEKIEQLIKDQKNTNKKTDEAKKTPAKLPEAKSAQKEVAKGTDEVRTSPLPPNAEAKAALEKAAEAMKAANKNLEDKDPSAAKPEQKNALKALEEAKKALDEQAAAIEQRSKDIAKLEDIKNKLEELAKNEKDVAKDAKGAATDPKKPETGDLAKKQDEITPPTKDVGKELKDLAEESKKADPKGADKLNEAADKVKDANTKQDGAKDDLKMNMPMAGGEKAMDAANKLDQAAKDVQMQLEAKKAMEANDQAALQPNKVDNQNATQQLQKAAEQANEAAQKANEAKQAAPSEKGTPNLAELQKQIAKQAEDRKLPEAAKSADKAAKALDKGDLPAAIENQQKALEQLAKDAMGEPKDGQNPGELANSQKKVLDATKAIQKSQQATSAAQAALQQAQANAPMGVQNQLNQANEALEKAAGQLQQGEPGQAGMNQQDAAQKIQQALDTLNNAQQQGMGMGMGMGMGEMGMGMGMSEGMGMGMGQGQGMGMGMGMGQGMAEGMGMGTSNQSNNKGVSEGDMNGGDKLKNVASSGTATSGDGTFINLRKKEREKVQQGNDAQFPAEFRELIKQYNVNIKNAKPVPSSGK